MPDRSDTRTIREAIEGCTCLDGVTATQILAVLDRLEADLARLHEAKPHHVQQQSAPDNPVGHDALEGLREAVLMTLDDDEFPVLRQLAIDAETVWASNVAAHVPGATEGLQADAGAAPTNPGAALAEGTAEDTTALTEPG